MKKTGIFLLLISSTIIQAQHSLQSELNLPRSGDVLIKQQVSYKDPGRTGADVLWDFSQLEIQNDGYELTYSAKGDSIIGTEHRTRYYYDFSNDTLRLLGYENATTQMLYLQPELQKAFPLAYNDTSLTCFQGKGNYGDRLQIDATGTIRTHADSYGMMILPNKDTLNHVLRVKTIKKLIENTQPMETETYQWYAQGYRYPIFETIKNRNISTGERSDYFATAFFFPPDEQNYLEEDEANVALRTANETSTDLWAGLTYNIYPNPVRTQPLNIEMYLPQSATVRVQVRNTMGNILIDKNQGNYPVGICNFQLNLQGLQTNNYILDIWLNEKLISETIMKR